MIPFASQRGGGQDLAAHLLNEHDNEYMELAGIRGAIADDLHGAFAEWEAEASAMTKCKNYLYSLSINPNPAQGPMPRALYDDYIARVEQSLGLDGQPRAVVYHIKEDKNSVGREHCHVVWSRIDVQEMKAIHMAFDHDKLMSVTRQFAREHNIELSPGYHTLEDRKRQTYRQLSLYEKAQQDAIGLSRNERMALITELWQGRDAPDSFIKALEYHGYILAEGKRPFVLVDIHGHVNSLPKLIDDKAVTTKEVRAFLGEAYSGENLPSIDAARESATEHRRALKEYEQSQAQADQRDLLKTVQEKRRAKLTQEADALSARKKSVQTQMNTDQLGQRSAQRSSYLDNVRKVKQTREAAAPAGLTLFLSKVTGVSLIQRKLQAYQDRQRHDVFLEQRDQLREQQDLERQDLQRRQEMLSLDMARKQRAMAQTEAREQRALEQSFERARQVRYRSGREHMPSVQLELRPPGRKAVPHKAINRFTSQIGRELRGNDRQRFQVPPTPDTLRDRFAKAAQDETDSSAGNAGEHLRKPNVPQALQQIPDITDLFEWAADAKILSQNNSGTTQPLNQPPEPEKPMRSFDPKPTDPDKDRER